MTPQDVSLVDGRSWSRSCRIAVGVVGVVGTFSLPLILRHSPCGFLYNLLCLFANDTVTSPCASLSVMAVDCGDEIPSKSNPQPAGVTSCMQIQRIFSVFAVAYVICQFLEIQTELYFRLTFREFRECSTDLLVFKRHSYPNRICNFWWSKFLFLALSLGESRDCSVNSLNVPSLH